MKALKNVMQPLQENINNGTHNNGDEAQEEDTRNDTQRTMYNTKQGKRNQNFYC